METYPVIEKRRMRSKKRKNIWQRLCSPRGFRSVMRVVLVLNSICRLVKALRELLG